MKASALQILFGLAIAFMIGGQVFQYRHDIAAREMQASQARRDTVDNTGAPPKLTSNKQPVIQQPPPLPPPPPPPPPLPPPPPRPSALNPADNMAPLSVADEHKRRQCIRASLEDTMGWKERGDHFYFRGCNFLPVIDLESWVDKTGCGTSPLVGPLLIHVGWTGPWLPHFLVDMEALIDSFLATQDLRRSKLTWWLLDREPDPADGIVAKYHGMRGPNGDVVVEFKFANTTEMSQGTCLEGRPALWDPPGEIQPLTKSDLLRILLLHKYGGAWIDTDTVLLRDLRPTLEIFGEFGGKFSMNQKFNNAMLSLRRGSPLSVKMLELSCAHPKSVQREDIDAFCRVTGNPCNTHWWYNHGPQQWAARNRHGLIAAPLQLFDPPNNCVSRGFLSGAGAGAMGDWTLEEAFELNRGAFALHTRSYQAKNRPLKHGSNFATLFRRVGELARERLGNNYNNVGTSDQDRDAGATNLQIEQRWAAKSLTPKGVRTEKEEAEYQRLRAKSVRLEDQLPDPPYLPQSPLFRVHVVAVPGLSLGGGADEAEGGDPLLVSFEHPKSRRPYELPLMVRKSRAYQRKDERAVWLWHPLSKEPIKAGGIGDLSKLELSGGFLRPSFTRTSTVYCLTVMLKAPSSATKVGLKFMTCDPRRQEQRWTFFNAEVSAGSSSVNAGGVPGGAAVNRAIIKSGIAGWCLYPRPQPNEKGEEVWPENQGEVVVAACGATPPTWSIQPVGYVGNEASIVDEADGGSIAEHFEHQVETWI